MKYKIEVDYATSACRVIHFPQDFDFPGDSVDACNYRIRKILEEGENGIDKSNLLGARIYDEKRKLLLDADYREKSLTLNIENKLNDFWIN
jgi:hypothetical protein